MPVSETVKFKIRDLAPRIGSEIVTDIEMLLRGACSARICSLLEGTARFHVRWIVVG